MAELEEAVYAILVGDAGVTALVEARVYPQKIPQDVGLPAVAYLRVSKRRVKSHSGPSGLARVRMQVNCTAGSYAVAKTVTAAIGLALDGIGVGGPVTVAGVEIHGSWLESEGDVYGEGEGLHGARQDFMFWCREVT